MPDKKEKCNQIGFTICLPARTEVRMICQKESEQYSNELSIK